jgi:hypothetical protein
MKILPIFAEENCLLSAHFDNEACDEFKKLFEEWADPEFLDDFFNKNKADLKRPYWNRIDVQQAILETIHEASKFRKLFIDLATMPTDARIIVFKNLFHPLGGSKINKNYLESKKAYGTKKNTWLRIYALKIGDDMFVITGGAIKLTDIMDEREHTKNELRKLDSCRLYLKNKGIIDEDGMIELLECQDYE